MADVDFEKLTRIIHPETTEKIPRKKRKNRLGHHRRHCCLPQSHRKGLADQIGKSEDTVKYHLASLQERKIILHIGPDNGGYWKVIF